MSATAEQVRAVLASRGDVELAVLFGSVAGGSERASSDVDLGVRWKHGTPADVDALLAQIERAVGRSIDLVELDAAPPQLRFEIARNGVVLVERIRHAWSAFRARAFVDWWDFAPIARIIHGAAVARLNEGERGSR
jgi:predicted nucleotidyltransferase